MKVISVVLVAMVVSSVAKRSTCTTTWGTGESCLSEADTTVRPAKFQCLAGDFGFAMVWGVDNLKSNMLLSYVFKTPYNYYYTFTLPVGIAANGTFPITNDANYWNMTVSFIFRPVVVENEMDLSYSATQNPKTVKVCEQNACCLTYAEGGECTSSGGNLVYITNSTFCPTGRAMLTQGGTYCLDKLMDSSPPFYAFGGVNGVHVNSGGRDIDKLVPKGVLAVSVEVNCDKSGDSDGSHVPQ